MKTAAIFLPILCLLGCSALTGEEVARLSLKPLTQVGDTIRAMKQTSLDLKKDDELGIWTEMNIEYEGDAAFRFEVQMYRDSIFLQQFEVDPMEKTVTLGEVHTTILDKNSWSFTGRSGKIHIDADGHYTFRAILLTSENPTLVVNKSDLFFKK